MQLGTETHRNEQPNAEELRQVFRVRYDIYTNAATESREKVEL
jgi:hypothetical protein